MSTVEVIDINGGDVENVRNASLGGTARIDGNVSVGHNLRVAGWLDAPNIRGINKGVFIPLNGLTALQNLVATHPDPQDGWIAGVVTTVNNDTVIKVYAAQNGDWVDTGCLMTFPSDVNTTQLGDLHDILDRLERISGSFTRMSYEVVGGQPSPSAGNMIYERLT